MSAIADKLRIGAGEMGMKDDTNSCDGVRYLEFTGAVFLSVECKTAVNLKLVD